MFSNATLFEAFNGVQSPVANTAAILLSDVVEMGTRAPDPDELDPQFVFSYHPLRRFLGTLRMNKNLWIWGPAGSGKTELAIQVALRCHRSYTLISFSEETSLRDLVGTWSLKSGETFWKDGALASAVKTPGTIIILDELNMAPAGVAASLNALLQQGEIRVSDTGDTLKVAKGVVFIATANTAGSVDETGLYAGSQIQNAATRSRFAGLKVDYLDADAEREIILRKYPDIDKLFAKYGDKTLSEAMVELARQIRSIVEEGKLSLPFSVRQILAWASASMEFRSVTAGFQFAFSDLLVEGEKAPVIEVFFKVFGITLEG